MNALRTTATKRQTMALSLMALGLTGMIALLPASADDMMMQMRRAPINSRQVAQSALPREMRRLRRLNPALMETTTVSHDPLSGKTYIEPPRPMWTMQRRGTLVSPGFEGLAPESAGALVQEEPDAPGEFGVQKVFGSDD